MAKARALERLPMTLGYFRLILRRHGDSAERRAAILAGTDVTEAMLRDPSASITLSQQTRQIENVIELFGEGWALRTPELWSPTSHGPVGVAAAAAPDVAAMMDVISRYASVRAPFYAMALRRGAIWSQVDYKLTVPLPERLWRPMVEISFIGIRSALTSVLAANPIEARFSFACAEPIHAPEVRAILQNVAYEAALNSIRFPSNWLTLESPFADTTLYNVAVTELREAARRVTASVSLQDRVEQILHASPAGRLTAEEVARRAGVSRRTLVRQLAEAGTGYRQLLDRELRERAERFLRDGNRSHAWVAEELGYTDAASFSRACRRWFGNARPGVKARPAY